MLSGVISLWIRPHAIIVTTSILLVLVSSVVSLRFLARKVLGTSLEIDDWLMIPSWLAFLALAIVMYIGADQKALWAPNPSTAIEATNADASIGRIWLALNVLQTAVFGLAKISVVFLFRRMFCVGHKGVFNGITIGLVTILGFWTVIFALLQLFQCANRLDAIWTPALNQQYCKITRPMLMTFAISDLLLGLFTLVLPMPRIWTLHVSGQKRLAITGIFFLSFIGLAACVMRLVIYITIFYFQEHIDMHHNIQLLNTESPFFGTLEAGITMMSVNLPALWGLCSNSALDRVATKMRSMLSQRSSISSSRHGSRAESEMFRPVSKSGMTITTFSGSPFQTAKSKRNEGQMSHRLSQDEEAFANEVIFVTRNLSVQVEPTVKK